MAYLSYISYICNDTLSHRVWSVLFCDLTPMGWCLRLGFLEADTETEIWVVQFMKRGFKRKKYEMGGRVEQGSSFRLSLVWT